LASAGNDTNKPELSRTLTFGSKALGSDFFASIFSSYYIGEFDRAIRHGKSQCVRSANTTTHQETDIAQCSFLEIKRD
jgi:hypothetical protein